MESVSFTGPIELTMTAPSRNVKAAEQVKNLEAQTETLTKSRELTIRLLQMAHNVALPHLPKVKETVKKTVKIETAETSERSQRTQRRGQSATKMTFNFFDFSSYFKSETHTHIHTGSKTKEELRSEKEKQESSNRALVGFVGVIIMVVSALFIGKQAAKHQAIESVTQDEDPETGFKGLQAQWLKNKKNYPDEFVGQVDELLKQSLVILNRNRNNRMINIALTVSLLAAGATGFLGAIISSNAVCLSALVIGGVTATASAFKYGYGLYDKRNTITALKIEKIKTDIENYDDNGVKQPEVEKTK